MIEKQFTDSDGRSAASKFGQMIGEAFESVVIEWVKKYIAHHHAEFELLETNTDGTLITLKMPGGLPRQMDTVIALKNSNDPVALLESKWLKDGRHHNDKGAWILQLREVRKRYATIRGAVAILAGYWTEGVSVMLMGEGGINMVLVATDEEVYGTLQTPLDRFLGGDSFPLDARAMRGRYPRPWDLANCLIDLQQRGELHEIAASWLEFPRGETENGNILTGKDLLKAALDDLLGPLPHHPAIRKFEIALQIDTGNTIYDEFEDVESLIQFIQDYYQNPERILRQITPRKKSNPDTD